MRLRNSINSVCAFLRRYSPVINFFMLVLYPILGIYLHFDLTYTIREGWDRASAERLAVYKQTNDQMIRVIGERVKGADAAIRAIIRNADELDRAGAERMEAIRTLDGNADLLKQSAINDSEQLAVMREILQLIKDQQKEQ